ncbi:hypothetical protein MATL_G00232560 [Megalops atlanticus]|uniref:Uncharacterized protein n=1 Tax=Megalops atlanticus TaxID=7932 RepID=A0A9D3PGG8_MEGAT|nr:hypothetical protein MATL_G00232560 [Megalops atlanticus]
MSWSIDGRNESGLTESIWTGESDAVTESVMNQVLVPVDEWERGITCTCMVDIDGNSTSKSVQSQGTNTCTVLLYGAIAGATVTIIVAISIAVYLHWGSSRESNANTWDERRTTATEHRIQSSGRQGRPSRTAVNSSISEVQYASLEEASLARRANTVLQ